MKVTLSALVLSGLALGLLAQEAVIEPEYVNEFFVLKDGKLERLEHQTLKIQSKVSNRIIAVKGTSSEVADGTQSSVRVAPDAHFIIRIHVGDIDPATLVKLKSFKIGKGDRELLMRTTGAHAFGGAQSKAADDATIPISIKKYGTKSFEVIPSQPLPPGEYVFPIMGLEADCFGVDGK